MDSLPIRITCSMSVWQRPQRTIRAIDCILNQNINGWEALITGDGDSDFGSLIASGYFMDACLEAEKNGNRLVIKNNQEHIGGFGFQIKNDHKQAATGKYFIYYDNDDVISSNHFENYLSEIEGTDLDFAYFNTYLEQEKRIRWAHLTFGHIGHSELIIRTDFLRTLPNHDSSYGHDWKLIESMIRSGAKSKYAVEKPQTYRVMGTPSIREIGID